MNYVNRYLRNGTNLPFGYDALTINGLPGDIYDNEFCYKGIIHFNTVKQAWNKIALFVRFSLTRLYVSWQLQEWQKWRWNLEKHIYCALSMQPWMKTWFLGSRAQPDRCGHRRAVADPGFVKRRVTNDYSRRSREFFFFD